MKDLTELTIAELYEIGTDAAFEELNHRYQLVRNQEHYRSSFLCMKEETLS